MLAGPGGPESGAAGCSWLLPVGPVVRATRSTLPGKTQAIPAITPYRDEAATFAASTSTPRWRSTSRTPGPRPRRARRSARRCAARTPWSRPVSMISSRPRWVGHRRQYALRRAPRDGAGVDCSYYPHLLVHPDFRRRGIGAEILRRLRRRYEALHMHILVADGRAVGFFEKCGFARAFGYRDSGPKGGFMSSRGEH